MTQRIFYPGDKWMYFKIYSAPTQANHILVDRILPLVTRWIEEGKIVKWFFIRYSDSGHHIRLRTELTKLQCIGDIITGLRKQLSEELGNGTVSCIQLDTYQRELERYGVNDMENCETFFFEDSCVVLDAIKTKPSDLELISHSIMWLYGLLFLLDMSDDRIKAYLKEMESRYQREFGLSVSQVKVINDEYRRLSPVIIKKLMKMYEDRCQEDDRYSWITAPDSSQYLLSSLVHMHMNRTFEMNQRLYEYIVYHMAAKGFDSLLKRT